MSYWFNTDFRKKIFLIAGTIYSILFVSNSLAEAQTQRNFHISTLEESLSQFLQAWDGDQTSTHIGAFPDLNDDGKPEAIVYLTGSKWCGSGGCTTLILAQDGFSWRIVTKITITRLPIRVLTKITHGWHAIGVWVQGGQIQPGYEAVLTYNGKSYPRNPTIYPAHPLMENLTGKVIIPLKLNEGG